MSIRPGIGQSIGGPTPTAHDIRLLELQGAIHDTYLEASQDDWDGEGSRAVQARTLAHATRLAHFLAGFPTPEIYADPHGHLGFEWYAGPQQVFALLVGPDGTLSYAGLFGSSHNYGTEVMDGRLASEILRGIRRVVG